MSSCPYAVLEITDGTTVIDCLCMTVKCNGVLVKDWKPSVPWYKDSGSWADSPIADGRVPVFGRRENIIDTFTISMRAPSTDRFAVYQQELVRMLEFANQYWFSSYSLTPAWLKVQVHGETNTRYALIYRAELPELGVVFGQPFLSFGMTNIMSDMTLVVEHGPWCSAPPTQPECIPANTLFPSHYAAYINMEGRYVNCGSDAGLDNLADNAFTIDGWFCPDAGDYGGGGTGCLAEKGTSAGGGWYFRVHSVEGMDAKVQCATTDAYSRCGLDDFTADGLWHHLAMTFDDAGDRKIRLWKDGAEVASYVSQTAGVGAIVADAAQDFAIGDAAVSLNIGFHGKVGWVRVSNNRRWTAAFTAPSRCTVPATDANTLGLWGGSGYGTTLYSQEGTTARNGTITDSGAPPLPVWGWDCDTQFGHADTCEHENVVIAAWHPWQLTHAYYYDADAGTWSANLITVPYAAPYTLLPAVPAINDALYIGIEGSAYFNNVVFNLSLAGTDSNLGWQEHQGAINANTWAAIAESYDTTTPTNGIAVDPLCKTGVTYLAWQQGASWTVGNLFQIFGGTAPPVTARWMRGLVGAWTGSPPTQATRHIYTANKPRLFVDDADVVGDIPVQLRTNLSQKLGEITVTLGVDFGFNDVLFGVRSYSRDGGYFQSYINLADTGNLDNVSVAVGGGSAFGNDAVATTGRAISRAVGAGVTVTPATITIEDVQYFTGTFRVFLRYYMSAGTAGSARITSPYPFSLTTQYVSLTAATQYAITDLGTITIPSRVGMSRSMVIYVYYRDDAAGSTISLYDLILFPLDECAFRATVVSPLTQGTGILVDDITYPKDGVTAWESVDGDDAFYSTGIVVSQQPPILQANRDQHIVIVPSYGGVSHNAQMGLMSLSGITRYLGLRGAR